MRHRIHAKNCTIEVIDEIDNTDIYLNLRFDRTGEEEQIVISRRLANALSELIKTESLNG
ncbi:hypothetical protein PP749_gp030 [Rhizobium phage RHEph22]|uniref:Uncharacterized protein n=1 Tax=Rhizobium phage RHEph22 TaxID=2836135 RepID=A0AAE7VMX8_9CAUD|nr:hypothetical protein PP749_gp030 [Rhizobium phage RHEph22]QXV74703.1 hypothetical protein [Rhizobium phage RHEph22]